MDRPRVQKDAACLRYCHLSVFSYWNETAFEKQKCGATPPAAIVSVAATLAFCYVLIMNRPSPDNDENDPIELWGTRIGRGLGFLITIGIILAIIVWLGAERQ
jgi:hypothetical protein